MVLAPASSAEAQSAPAALRVESRPSTPEDRAFLRALFFEAKRTEGPAGAWPEELLAMQFLARERGYQGQFPQAQDRILLVGGEPVGRLWVAPEEGAWQVIDVAVSKGWGRRGVATAALLAFRAEVNHARLRLQVVAGNPAQRLYQRLGFVVVATDPVRISMEWSPGVPKAPGRDS